MIIAIGSFNDPKFEALQAARRHYPRYAQAGIIRVRTESGVVDQPLDIATALKGAANRASRARIEGHADLGVGIEDTLMPLPYAKSGWGNVSTCILDDGKRTFPGVSPAYELPEDIVRYILEDGLNLSQASHRAGYTNELYLGGQDGIIGILTGGRITRAMKMEHAIEMAFINLARVWEQPR